MRGEIGFGGSLSAELIPGAEPAPLLWRLRNWMRPAFLWGWLCYRLASAFTAITGIPTIVARLEATLIRADGRRVHYGVLGYRVVTDAGVAFLVDDWDNDATDITTMNYHACGTDSTAEAATDTALGAEATTVTDRVAGTKSQPAANQLQTVGTQSFTGTAAITEHGLFSSITEGAGTLWDRSVFAAINVGSGDSIQWTYTCTINSGG